MRVSILGQFCVVILLSCAGIVQAQSNASPGESVVLAELTGVWTLENDSGQTSYVAFARSPFAIYRGRLAEVDVSGIKRYADAEAEAAGLREVLDDRAGLSEVSERLGDVLIDRIDNPRADESMREQGRAEASSAINARLRDRLDRLLVIMADAAERGDGTLTTINISFSRAPDLVGDLDRQSTSLAYSGNRLYFVIRERLWIYDRVSTLSGQSANDWPNGGRQAWERRLENEYDRLFSRCVVYQRSELPLDECRAHRDAMAEFGVELRPEFILERFRNFDKPSTAEMTFWRNRMMPHNSWSDTFPALDYCYSGVSSSGSVGDFITSLAGKGFANTLWRLSLLSNAPLEKPSNWTEQEFREWAPVGDQSLSGLQGAIFLRADGVLGFGPNFDGLAFDPRNRWAYSDGVIRLTWNDASIDVQIPVVDYVNANGTTNLALANRAFAELVLGNYDLLMKMPYPERHPDYERLRPFTESQRCDTGDLTTSIAKPNVEPKPEIEWPSRPAADVFPAHWHARTDMTDGSTYPDPDTWAGMQSGGYYHLLGSDSSRSGSLGVNVDAPAGFAYDRGARWQVSGSTLTWQWEQFDTFVFELPNSYTGTISAVGQRNPQYTMVLTPTDLLEPGVRRLQSETRPEPVMELKAPPEPRDAESEVKQAIPAEPPAKPVLIGCWHWSNGAQISIEPDGVVVNGPIRGQWQASVTANQFEIVWPPIEDTITLASNGRSFTGVGLFGTQFSATRIGLGTGLAGQWRRQDGVILEFTTDGVATGGPMRGQWSSESDRKFRIEWPLVDDVTVAKDGERLNAVNQFGRVTATRRTGC